MGGDRVTFDGKVVHVHDVVLDCPLPPRIPVLVAARGPRMLALAGEIADIVHLASLFLGRDARADDRPQVPRQRALQRLEALFGAGRGLAHPEAEIGRHLVVARARGVQPPGGGADQFGEPRLDIEVDILVRLAEGESARRDLAADFR